MVGVPGKFKGCNTCRVRRVKCDNQKPACKKCIDSGRECGGYERERVFIVGTKKDGGRCSSHPHRSFSMQKKQKPPGSPPRKAANRSLAKVEDENGISLVQISNPPSNNIRCLVLHTNLLSLNPMHDPDGESFTLSSPTHSLPDPARPNSTPDFSLSALCLVHLCAAQQDVIFNHREGGKGKGKVTLEPGTTAKIEDPGISICLFLYEVCPPSDEQPNVRASLQSMKQDPRTIENSPWKRVLGGNTHLVKQRGPSSYKSFPGHNFFTRLYRKEACFDAMMRRKATFLADPEWCSVPWEEIPKSDMDRLFDIQVLLPGIIERGERLEGHPPSFHRRLKAKDLLQNCFQIDKMFNSWHKGLQSQSENPLFWLVDSVSSKTTRPGEEVRKKPRPEMSPFSSQLEFADLMMAFLHVYYWAALCLFYRSIQHIHTLFAEEIDSSSSSPSPRAFASPLQPPAAPTRSFTSPHQTPAQLQRVNRFISPQPQPHFQSVAVPLQDLELLSMPTPQPFGPYPSSQALNLLQYDTPFLIPTNSNSPASSPYAASPPSFQDFAFPTTSTPVFASSPALASSTATITPSPPLPPRHARQGAPPTYALPSYHPLSQTRSPTPVPTPVPSSSSQLQVPAQLPPVPPLNIKYNEMAIFKMANLISQAMPYILKHTSSSAPTAPLSPSNSTISPSILDASSLASSGFSFNTSDFGNAEASIFGSSASAFGSFGPDHTLWPLLIARQVYRRQSRAEYLAWCGQQMEIVKREGQDVAKGILRSVWREWSNENEERYKG